MTETHTGSTLPGQKFPTRMLTRDPFEVANPLVYNYYIIGLMRLYI